MNPNFKESKFGQTGKQNSTIIIYLSPMWLCLRLFTVTEGCMNCSLFSGHHYYVIQSLLTSSSMCEPKLSCLQDQLSFTICLPYATKTEGTLIVVKIHFRN